MPGPLSKLEVLDFSTLFPGPYATQILADLGANVLRIEAPFRPDLLRHMSPPADGESAAHLSINRNKRSLAIDLKKAQGVKIAIQLVEKSDVLVEQFRPGTMDRLGLGYAGLHQIKPSLIYCSISGYGQNGPLAQRSGHDINFQALSGLASYSGRSDTGPVLSAVPIADAAGGSHQAVIGILAALLQRQATGLGQHLDISMSDGALSLNGMFGAGFLMSGQAPGCGTEMLNGGTLYDYYKTRDGRYIAVGCIEPKFVQRFFSAIGHADWTQRAYSEHPEELAALKQDVAEVVLQKDLATWQAVFEPLDACVDPVLNLGEVFKSSHFHERKMFHVIEESIDQSLTQIASPLKFKNAQPTPNRPGPKLGEHTDEVLTELGYNPQSISKLRHSGTVA